MAGPPFVLGGESCLLTLDYAWYHVGFCLLQAGVLWRAGRTRHFALAHAFGLFATLMDYGLGFLVRGTRTVAYPGNPDMNMDGGQEALGPLGEFVFFAWFDYAAFGLVVWALALEDRLRDAFARGAAPALAALRADPVGIFALCVAPVQFWTAPWLSASLGLDDRTLLLARSSPKMAYMVAVPLFMGLLHLAAGLPKYDIAAIMLSGFGCGCVHHLALFVFGMRGYSDFPALALTLLTEWPALIAGLAVFRRLGYGLVGFLVPSSSSASSASSGPRVRGTTVFNMVMWAGLLSILGPRLAAIEEEDAISYLIPFVPGQHMQTVGTQYLRFRTCLKPALGLGEERLACWDDGTEGETDGGGGGGGGHNVNGTDFLILASAAKSGAVLSAKIVAEVGGACGYCVASPERSRAGIPGPVETLPSYDGNLLFAIINMVNWPEYTERQGFGNPLRGRTAREVMEGYAASARDLGAAQAITTAQRNAHLRGHTAGADAGGAGSAGARIRCVTTLRDPLSRLRSLYLYARSGGEAWFRYQSGLMQKLQASGRESLGASLRLFWDEFGRAYLVQSHEYMLLNLGLGCTPVKMEDLKRDFDGSMRSVLRAWGVREAAVPPLVARLSGADLGRKTEAQRRADPHVTANKFSPGLVRGVVDGLMEMDDVRRMVEAHRQELGY